MKLSILITRYKESWDICRSMFDSIALQRGISFDDVEVIVVNDGRDKLLTGREFNGYPFHVKYLPMPEHGGISRARNYGLDHSTGDYVMFCDIDDMFLNSCGLYLIFGAMHEGYDSIGSSFIEEHFDKDGTYKIIRHDKDNTFVHGKVFRRQFLIDENIRFKDELTIHEDGYFNLIAAVVSKERKEITTPFYLWKCNKESTVRKDPINYVLKTYDHLMKAREAISDELNARGEVDKYIDSVCKTVIDSYYDFNKPNYLDPKNKELVEKAEKAFKSYYLKFRQDYLEANINRIAEIKFVSYSQAFTNGMRVEQRTISEWLTHIMKEV